jgi:hypothetical protein
MALAADPADLAKVIRLAPPSAADGHESIGNSDDRPVFESQQKSLYPNVY